MIKTAINRRVPHEEIDPLAQEDAEGGGGLSRLETLLPLLRKFILVVLVVMTVMICVSALGLNIGPLLAGAGVVGIAIGFGAQALVRDIVSGVFFLIDDAFRTGEYIDVGLAKGSVEKSPSDRSGCVTTWDRSTPSPLVRSRTSPTSAATG